ncbi:MAG: PcfJ domain-containing protein [Lachnospiraceae bacterium]|nr:PcfJ domain-containing protein [Lachnospiraceae bacterium]
MNTRIFYVTIPNTTETYCSLCGKRVAYKDTYNFKQHVKLYHNYYDADDVHTTPVSEYSYAYAFEAKGTTLYLLICEVSLDVRPGMPDRYSGAHWRPVFRLALPMDKKECKVLENETLLDADGWIEKVKNRSIPRLTRETDLEIIHEAFPSVVDIYSLDMFFYIYLTRGYQSRQLLAPALARKLVTFDFQEMLSRLKELKQKKRMVPRLPAVCQLHREKAHGHLFLKLLVMDIDHDDQVIPFLFCGTDYIYTPEVGNFRLGYLLSSSLVLDKDSLRLARIFAKAYPETCLSGYLEHAESPWEHPCNPLAPLLGGTYHKLVELTAKAGLSKFAGYLDHPYFKKDPNSYKNLKEVFGGLPLRFLKTLGSSALTAPYLDAFADVKKRNPAFLIERLSPSGAHFLVEADIADYGRHAHLQYVGALPDKQVLRILRYVNALPLYMYYEYRDYINLCVMAGNEFRYGLIPADLGAAHDHMVLHGSRMHDARQYAKAFDEKVHADPYLRLTTSEEEEPEESPYRILAPEKIDDLYAESTQMHNCVRTYVPAVANGHTSIYFLRNKADPDQSFGTIEVRDQAICQAKGFANAKLPATARRHVRCWAKEKGLAIMTHDL